MKIIHTSQYFEIRDMEELDKMKQEIILMQDKEMGHDNIIDLVDFFDEANKKWYLVMNLAD